MYRYINTRRNVMFLLIIAVLSFALYISSEAVAGEPSAVWNLAELKQVPKAQWSDPVEKEGGILLQKVYYSGEAFQGRPSRVFAFMARPQGEGPFPGIVLVHGGGGMAFSQWAELWAREGYAAIAMDLAGNEVLDDGSRQPLADGGPGQSDGEKICAFEPDEYKKVWTYHAVADIMRANSLLRSLPYVDTERTAATGISWGGYLTSMIAGIDDRFRVVVPVYGCGDLERNSVWTNRFKQLQRSDALRWKEFFDPIEYVGRAQCRLFFVAGTDDFAYPLDIHYNTYSSVPQSDVRLQVHMPHGHEVGWAPKEIAAYINSVLKGAPELPCLEKISYKREADGTITVSAPIKYNPAAAKTARLHYSTDLGGFDNRGKWTVRSWADLPAEIIISNGTENQTEPAAAYVTAKIPAEIAEQSPLRVFLDVQTADSLMVSSHYVLCEPVSNADDEPAPK